MVIHVNIGEAKTRFSELVAAAMRGETVIVQNAGVPQVKLVPVDVDDAQRRAEIAAQRVANIGIYKEKYKDLPLDIPPLMTEEEIQAREDRICGLIA
jgi:prevent-host-death family protein